MEEKTELKQEIIKAKAEGLSDVEIGRKFGISFKQLEKILTEAYGANIAPPRKPLRIKYWAPKNFKEETTTVWSFKHRGDWATHNPRYRGNWSPYIPRNVILKYSEPGEIVLDYFVGGGTTAIEAKLLGRRCIARDINPVCVELTKENLSFTPPKGLFTYPIYEPEVSVGDARDLSDIPDESIDLICAHPPYAGIINYSSKIEGDLSNLDFDDFLSEMKKVAKESYRVLRPGKKCALLIGDARRRKHIVPLGFRLLNVFLEAGFKLKELIIKRQHNCKTTGFWYEKSIRYNFLLIAHEYLPIFEKPSQETSEVKESVISYTPKLSPLKETHTEPTFPLETTTVWLFPERDLDECIKKNIIARYGKESLFFPIPLIPQCDIKGLLTGLMKAVRESIVEREKPSFLVVQVKDMRENGYVNPLGKLVYDVVNLPELWLKEIIIVAPENFSLTFNTQDNLEIIHQYLLVYEVKK